MSRRKQGSLLHLEVRILEIAEKLESKGDVLYGFALASALSADDGKSLTSHGTLYKALARMTEAGLLEATWEDPESAAKERRPRRRFYRITTAGKTALRAVQSVAPTSNRVPTFQPVQA
jgi:DNA-binding PadR family transcriptional regulator